MYIQVIVPLKLDWEPVYSVPEGLELVKGDRVSVIFSGKEYISVVSKLDVTPRDGIRESEILPVIDKVDYLPRITELEFRFWEMTASYYLCTLGEVYKSVYFRDQQPPRKWTSRDRSAVATLTELSAAQEKVYKGILDAPKTVLLQGVNGSGKREVCLRLAASAMKEGKSVLYLVPEIAFSNTLEQRVSGHFPDYMLYHSGLTPAKKRDVVLEARTGKAVFVLGARSALWIPFKNLGLIILDQEHEASFKQDSPAPRYNARESAIMLSTLCGAKVVLISSTPSLESLYNADNGIFTKFELNERFNSGEAPESVVIDLGAEKRKWAVSGSFSLKLLAHIKNALEDGGKVLVVCRAKAAIDECREELEAIFPGAAGIDFVSPIGAKTVPEGEYALIAVLMADSILGREDFRSDERALQLFSLLGGKTGLLVIQTRESSHPVFSSARAASLLSERKVAGYPPYTRLVTVSMSDTDQHRLSLRSRFLMNRLREKLQGFSEPQILGSGEGVIRIFFKRDRNLQPGKQALYREITSFEQQYSCHIVIDVDPV